MIPQSLHEHVTPKATESDAKNKRLAKAFESVFGQARHRSQDQKLVCEHIRKFTSCDTNCERYDKEGRYDPLATASVLGARSTALMIDRQLDIARRSDDKPKQRKVKK